MYAKKLNLTLIVGMALTFIFSTAEASGVLKIYDGNELKERQKKTSSTSILKQSSEAGIIIERPITQKSIAMQKIRTSLRYFGKRLAYKEHQAQNALVALCSVLNSDKKEDLIDSLIAASVEGIPKQKEKYKPGKPRVYNNFKEFVYPHFSAFSQKTVDQHIISFFAPLLGECSSFYTREDCFGFNALFGEIVEVNKKQMDINEKQISLLSSVNTQTYPVDDTNKTCSSGSSSSSKFN